MTGHQGTASPGGSGPGQGGRQAQALLFIGDMYAVQLDQLAAKLGISQRAAGSAVSKWLAAGLIQAERLSAGPRWIWLTRAGLRSCGLPYQASKPGLSRLAHLRAVTAVRLALEAAPAYTAGDAHWRSERRIRTRAGGTLGSREHLPDAEVHWPDGTAAAWAGECWAIEAELTRKTLTRTTAIMRELLARTGDYGCPAADACAPGAPARHHRVLYLCSRTAGPVVARASQSLGVLGRRIEIRYLPCQAELPSPPARATARPGEAAGR